MQYETGSKMRSLANPIRPADYPRLLFRRTRKQLNKQYAAFVRDLLRSPMIDCEHCDGWDANRRLRAVTQYPRDGSSDLALSRERETAHANQAEHGKGLP